MYNGHIEDYIPWGAENAIERSELMMRAEIPSDSTMRMEISEAKLRTPILSSCRYKGYFRPRMDRPGERMMAIECRDELKSKALKMLSQLKTLENFINPSGQLDLFSEGIDVH